MSDCNSCRHTDCEPAKHPCRTCVLLPEHPNFEPVEPAEPSWYERVKADAEAHWAYTGQVVQKCKMGNDVLLLCEYLYTAAFAHGAKHQKENSYD